MAHVYLNADGTHATGDYVLILAATGVTYETQCGGYACEQRSAEGYLVSVGPSAAVTALDEWFAAEFRGHCYEPESNWTSERVERLAALIAELTCWTRDADGEDRPTPLALDRSRLKECVEAWAPVLSPTGAAILLRTNSD